MSALVNDAEAAEMAARADAATAGPWHAHPDGEVFDAPAWAASSALDAKFDADPEYDPEPRETDYDSLGSIDLAADRKFIAAARADVPALLADRAARVRLAQEAAAREASLTWRLCEARANARILAHSYEHDSRPPPNVVRESLAYAVDQRASMANPSPAAAALLRVVEAARAVNGGALAENLDLDAPADRSPPRTRRRPRCPVSAADATLCLVCGRPGLELGETAHPACVRPPRSEAESPALECAHCEMPLPGGSRLGPNWYGDGPLVCSGCGKSNMISVDGETEPYNASDCETNDEGECVCPLADAAPEVPDGK